MYKIVDSEIRYFPKGEVQKPLPEEEVNQAPKPKKTTKRKVTKK